MTNRNTKPKESNFLLGSPWQISGNFTKKIKSFKLYFAGNLHISPKKCCILLTYGLIDVRGCVYKLFDLKIHLVGKISTTPQIPGFASLFGINLELKSSYFFILNCPSNYSLFVGLIFCRQLR